MSATDEPVCRLYRIRGKVQGVGFRHFVYSEAKARAIGGWVRNRLDGSVEAFAEAPPQTLDGFERVLSRGPRWGRVDTLEKTEARPADEPTDGFRVRATV